MTAAFSPPLLPGSQDAGPFPRAQLESSFSLIPTLTMPESNRSPEKLRASPGKLQSPLKTVSAAAQRVSQTRSSYTHFLPPCCPGRARLASSRQVSQVVAVKLAAGAAVSSEGWAGGALLLSSLMWLCQPRSPCHAASPWSCLRQGSWRPPEQSFERERMWKRASKQKPSSPYAFGKDTLSLPSYSLC